MQYDSEGFRSPLGSATAHSSSLTRKVLAPLLPLGALRTGFDPIPAWAQSFTFTQVTNTPSGHNWFPSISDDGTRITFRSSSNPFGHNGESSWETVLWTDGSGLTEITNTDRNTEFPRISGDGAKIALYGSLDPTGSNTDHNTEIFLWTDETGITQLTDTGAVGVPSNQNPSVNSDGTKIAFWSNANLTGGNCDGTPPNCNSNYEIFLWDAGSDFAQLTDSSGQDKNWYPSINSDGTKIAFASSADLTNGNSDHNEEIFLWNAGGTIDQITSSDGGATARNLRSAATAPGSPSALERT